MADEPEYPGENPPPNTSVNTGPGLYARMVILNAMIAAGFPFRQPPRL